MDFQWTARSVAADVQSWPLATSTSLWKRPSHCNPRSSLSFPALPRLQPGREIQPHVRLGGGEAAHGSATQSEDGVLVIAPAEISIPRSLGSRCGPQGRRCMRSPVSACSPRSASDHAPAHAETSGNRCMSDKTPRLPDQMSQLCIKFSNHAMC